MHLQSPTRALLTFTKQKTPSWVMSTALRSVPLHHLSRSRELSPFPLFTPIRSLICGITSLGNAAIFLVGGLTRDVAPVSILLRSGDVVVMSGPACRRAYHGVPRILEGTLPAYLGEGTNINDGLWTPYAQYMNTTRININVRQVFPKGFNPGLAHT